MSSNLTPFDSSEEKRKTIEEELNQINQLKFKFGCLGINCLGWIIIIAIILIIYFIRR